MSPAPTPSEAARPNPGAMARRRPTSASAPAKVDPSQWGRIDEDGTVYVTIGGTERKIGQWQAGSVQEGLAHYAARFEDLVTELQLLEERVRRQPDEAWNIQQRVKKFLSGLPEAIGVGDFAGLEERARKLVDKLEEVVEKPQDAKERLAKEAEEIAEKATDWKEAGDRMREILEEWRKITGLDKATDDALWKRYAVARDAFNRRRGSHFAELDRLRANAKREKEELIERAEKLKDSTDWAETARAFAGLMREWKAAGRAARNVDNALWDRFKAAQDHFFAARNADRDRQDEEFNANAAAKDALLAEYEPHIDPAKDLRGAHAKLLELQEKWEEIGFVPRNQVREYEQKIRTLEKKVADAEAAQWQRTDPEVQARANQFTEKAEKLLAQAGEAEAKGKTADAAKLREQAAQWQQWAKAAQDAVNG